MKVRGMFSLDGLRATMEQAQQRLSQHAGRGAGTLLALTFAIVALGIALSLASGGYHGGFFPVYRVANTLLPDQAWAWITRFGDARVLFVLSLLLVRRRPEIFWTLIVAALIGGLYSHGLKTGFDQVRPPGVLPADAIRVIGPSLTRHSFPSGHTLSAFLFAGVLFAYCRSWPQRLLLLAAAALVGVSRVALGVHWPQDALAGAFSGLMIAGLAVWLTQFWRAGLRPRVHLGLVVLPLVAMYQLATDDSGNPSTPVLVVALILVGLISLVLGYRDLLARRRG
ncbi:MAG: phosphatase PAP2 family protein [Chromatiaceae bacterium]|jgi:membrane-associated phospholipid phosphatase|nr:phosphatase PAP2 family protein [Chromatiaceae bacterium]